MARIHSRFSQEVVDEHRGIDYYAKAEGWLAPFWNQPWPFRDLFDRLDLSRTVDLACGHGRHTAQIIDRAGAIILVDANQANIDACRKRFARRKNVSYYKTTGNELDGLESSSCSSVFSYDSMVHFEALDVIDYLREISRVLRPGGLALLHYSNFEAFPQNSFKVNPHWRNFFSRKMMVHFATRFSLEALENRVIDWPPEGGGTPELDAVALLRRSS